MYPGLTPSTTIRQSDIAELMITYRLVGLPVALRVPRQCQGGGFGDQERHPYTWTVVFLVDGQWARVESTRGLLREWASLDKVERWLRAFGFRQFTIRNDFDPIETPAEAFLRKSSLK